MSSSAKFPLVQNAIRPEGWKAAAPFPPTGTTTFSRQHELKKLPVPEFSVTMEKLKRSLRPLAHSEEEWQTTLRRLDDFAKRDGPVLHKRLVERKDRDDIAHWMEEWWDDVSPELQTAWFV